MRPGQGLVAVDLRRQGVERGFVSQQSLGVIIHKSRVADMAVAQDEGTLGGLDQAMDEGKVIDTADTQAIEQGQDQQRREALGRRGGVVEPGSGNRRRQRHRPFDTMRRQILGRHRRSRRCQVGGDVARHLAIVEAGQAVTHQPPQGLGQGRLFQPVTLSQRPARAENLRITEHIPELGILGGGDICPALGHGDAMLSVINGGFENARQRYPAAVEHHRPGR